MLTEENTALPTLKSQFLFKTNALVKSMQKKIEIIYASQNGSLLILIILIANLWSLDNLFNINILV